MRAVLVKRGAQLDAAIEAARSTNISVTRAKRLQKELQAQAAAAGASLVLVKAVAEAPSTAAAADGLLRSLQVRMKLTIWSQVISTRGFDASMSPRQCICVENAAARLC